MSSNLAIILRSKKLGVLIKDSRIFNSKTKKECGLMLGISGGAFNSIENGKRSISLYELEILANNFSISLKHFFQDALLSEKDQSDIQSNQEDMEKSKFHIKEIISKAYSESGMTYKDLKEKTGISSVKMRKYLNNEVGIPITELELLCDLLNINHFSLISEATSSGRTAQQNIAIEEFKNLDPKMQNFVSQPENIPYLELAYKLSSQSSDQIRAIAEGLLEISV